MLFIASRYLYGQTDTSRSRLVLREHPARGDYREFLVERHDFAQTPLDVKRERDGHDGRSGESPGTLAWRLGRLIGCIFLWID